MGDMALLVMFINEFGMVNLITSGGGEGRFLLIKQIGQDTVINLFISLDLSS